MCIGLSVSHLVRVGPLKYYFELGACIFAGLCFAPFPCCRERSMGNFILLDGHSWLSLLGRRSDMTLKDGGVVFY
jgi:hypothetical protein